jgi:glycosyltransferase involved in cell wall biosynthesis
MDAHSSRHTPLRICYFGVYDPLFSRNKTYQQALRAQGITVVECHDRSRGLKKFWRLAKQHWRLRHSYDAMIVGYTSYIAVPFARLISRKPIIFDALCTFYETQIISRNAYANVPFRLGRLYVWLVDQLAFRCADVLLVETEMQKRYFMQSYRVPERKIRVVRMNADETIFFRDGSNPKRPRFTAVFRGKYTLEAGIEHVIDAARILKDELISFLILSSGPGDRPQKLVKLRDELGVSPDSCEIITRYLADDEMRTLMSSCHASLGQFEDNERLDRTIPHKCYESMAMGLPFITAYSPAVAELLLPDKGALYVKRADSQGIADAVKRLADNPALARTLADTAYTVYQENCSLAVIGTLLVHIINETIH